MITTSNTVVSPMRMVPQLHCLAEWFATRPHDFETETVQYEDAFRAHDRLFIDDAFRHMWKTHCSDSNPDKHDWTKWDWGQKANLALFEAEYLATILD